MPHSHAVVLLILIIISAISGVLVGWFFGDVSLQIGWLGDLFLNALKW